MNTNEVLKLALDALEINNKAWKALADSGDAGFWEAEEQPFYELSEKAITALREALAKPDFWEGYVPEPVKPAQPVAMRMPKVGDEVVCIEDESLGVVAYLTAGGSPEIRFDDGSHGTYVLREFAELFRYTSPPAQRTWVDLTPQNLNEIFKVANTGEGAVHLALKLIKEKNT